MFKMKLILAVSVATLSGCSYRGVVFEETSANTDRARFGSGANHQAAVPEELDRWRQIGEEERRGDENVEKGDHLSAIEAYTAALNLKPDAPHSLRLKIASAALKADDTKLALEHFRWLLVENNGSSYFNDPVLLVAYGEAEILSGNRDKAAVAFRRAVKAAFWKSAEERNADGNRAEIEIPQVENDLRAVAHAASARSKLIHGDAEGAVEEYQYALALSSSLTGIRLLRVSALRANEQHDLVHEELLWLAENGSGKVKAAAIAELGAGPTDQ